MRSFVYISMSDDNFNNVCFYISNPLSPVLALFSGSARSYRHSPEIPIDCLEPHRYASQTQTYIT